MTGHLRWNRLILIAWFAVVASSAPGLAAAPAFPAANGLTWDIQLAEIEIDPIPAVSVIEIDGEDATAEQVARLHDSGITVICYINVGVWEEWRSDANRYPESLIGNAYPGWPGERFIDIREIDTLAPILRARLDICVDKGFDAVDPDYVDTFETDTGFDLTRNDQVRFNSWLAAEAHARDLAIGQKNVPDLAGTLVSDFDFAVTEDCLVDDWCDAMQPYADAGKPVMMVEYTDRDLTNADICAMADGTFGSVVIKHRELDRWTAHCPV